MKFILKFSVLLLLLVLACSRQNKEYIGPAYVSAPEGFGVTSFTAPSSIDFIATTPMTLSAAFTSSVTWTLTITGQESGAVHQVTGISNGFTNLEWAGNHDGVNFFRTGETATATLSFFGNPLTASTTTTLVRVPNYKTCGKFPNYGDFEDATRITPANRWHPFNSPTPIPNVDQGVDSDAVDYNGDTVKAAEGKQYYYIRGLGNQPTFVSGIQNTAPITGLPADASQVWVNMYIYGTGDPNCGVELEYQESDIGKTPGYQPDEDDAFVAYVTLSHRGWKLFSFRYSDLTPSLNAAFGGSGNHIHEPNRLRSFDLVLVKKTNPNSPIEVYFDYPIITVGGPFKPCH